MWMYTAETDDWRDLWNPAENSLGRLFSPSEWIYRTCKPAQGFPLLGYRSSHESEFRLIPCSFWIYIFIIVRSSKFKEERFALRLFDAAEQIWARLCIYLIKLEQKRSGASGLDCMRVGLWYGIRSVTLQECGSCLPLGQLVCCAAVRWDRASRCISANHCCVFQPQLDSFFWLTVERGQKGSVRRTLTLHLDNIFSSL